MLVIVRHRGLMRLEVGSIGPHCSGDNLQDSLLLDVDDGEGKKKEKK